MAWEQLLPPLELDDLQPLLFFQGGRVANHCGAGEVGLGYLFQATFPHHHGEGKDANRQTSH